ncbi:MAG: PAS domain S-box protein [Chloroflexi bacterium]|nr:PAS domain S-box protein [Chloroflexota bacterium]
MLFDAELARELEATREQLRNLIERNADAIVVVDQNGVVRFANPAAERLFRQSRQELIGAPLGMPVVVGEITEVDIVGQGDEVGVAEMRVVETEWGGASARLAVLRDITERKRAEQQRELLFQEQVARAQAEEALRERDEFLALASHELKTPAATLSATAQLLHRQLERQGNLEREQLDRALERLQEQSQRLGRLVDRLLDVSRINASRLTIEPEPTNLVALVAEVVAANQLTTSRHTIMVQGPDELQAVVDRDRVTQVVNNLLDNAIKYSPEGGLIEVNLSRTAFDEACLAVRDHGVGIPEDQRDMLFERFYRAHDDDQFSGMGLGLFVTRHVVELHGGSISVDSPPDGGARFTVRVPLRNDSAHTVH